MRFFFHLPSTGYQKELLDIAHIFFPSAELAESADDADCQVFITETTIDNRRTCRLKLAGAFEKELHNQETVSTDSQEEKRLHKRQQKLAFYHALKGATRRQPPWGSLTGVRPTRLLYEQMEGTGDLNQATERLIKVFDVSRPKAELLQRIVQVQQGLPQAMKDQVDVYIGIPFCTSRCRYCSFISQEVGDGRLLPGYVEALCQELEGLIRLMSRHGLRARTVYMGGGTPTSLNQEQLTQVLAAAKPLVMQAEEVTVEAGRPDTITAGKLQVLKGAGVGRISINPQTMFDDTLLRMGRNHTKAQTESAFYLARQAGLSNINMDLIAGLPGEDAGMFSKTLSWVLDLNPESVTVHTLAIKRSSRMHQFQETAGEGTPVEEMVDQAHERLRLAGYQPYYLYRQKHMAGNLENTGYAKPGYACLYNLGMMEENTTVLSVGAGSMSKRVWPDRSRILRAPNIKNVLHYINRVDEMLNRKDALMQGVGKGVKPALSLAQQADVLPLKLENQA